MFIDDLFQSQLRFYAQSELDYMNKEVAKLYTFIHSKEPLKNPPEDAKKKSKCKAYALVFMFLLITVIYIWSFFN
jgi:hypothetical protein